jgi:diguanylate cyclase
MSSNFLQPQFQPSALLYAWLLAAYALYLQSLVIRRVRAHDREAGFGWILGGALCVGTGIWAETFVGLMALSWPFPVGYMKSVVLASWLPAVVISGGAIWLQSNPALPLRFRIPAGLMASAGMFIVTLINISSVVIEPGVHWRYDLMALAALLMLMASVSGSVLIRRALDRPLSHLGSAGAAAVTATLFRLGQTLVTMAIAVPLGATCLSVNGLSGSSLEVVLTASVLVVFALVHLFVVQDARAQQRQQALQQSLQQAQTALAAAAQIDSATGMPNRLGFEQAMHKALAADNVARSGVCVMRLSLDNHQHVVDTFGQDHGDAVVRQLARRLQALVRDTDTLSRSDTDEFLLLAQGLDNEHVMAQVAQRISDALRSPCLVRDHDIVMNVSIGIARFPASSNAEQLLAHSRDAMLTARKAGGGVYCFYEPGMAQRGVEQIEMQRDLRHAIERNELQVHFQPKLRAHDNTLAGVEALLRWTHPVRGSVSPAQFIPVAERFGLIGELGLWVLDQACRHIRMWHDAGLNIPVAVNLSAHQLRQPDLEQRVREVLSRHRVPARMLIMEITESTAMDDIEGSLRVFDMLADIGVSLSIDDFGTGYSSLSYLRRLPARQLKIDRSFVKDLAHSKDAQAIVEAVVRLSHALGLKVVAEGVETQSQADILAQLQCDELQGFLFAKPMPEGALLAWLVNRGTQVPSVEQAGHTGRITPQVIEEYGWSEMEAASP